MNGTLFRDAILIMLLAFVALVVWMLPFLNPPAQEAKSEPPGNLIVHIVWPNGNIDVDLWVDGPGEPVPVGYSNKGGVLWNLLRDDLGTFPDVSGINYENAFTRGIFPGEYTVNVHCYRCPQVPVPVEVEVSLKTGEETGKGGGIQQIASSRVELRFNGQERTAIRFTLDDGGGVVPDSFSTVFKPLRNMRAK